VEGQELFANYQAQIFKAGRIVEANPMGQARPLCLEITRIPSVPGSSSFKISSGDISGLDVRGRTSSFTDLLQNVRAIVHLLDVTAESDLGDHGALSAQCAEQLRPIFDAVATAKLGNNFKRVIFVVSKKDMIGDAESAVTAAFGNAMEFVRPCLTKHKVAWNEQPIFVDSLGIARYYCQHNDKPKFPDEAPLSRLIEEIHRSL